MTRRRASSFAPPAVRRRLQRWRMAQLIRRFPARVVRHRYAGFDLAVELQDPLAAGWYDHDWDHLPELDVLSRSALRPGARVFDLGAHQGVVGMILGRHVGPNGHVVLVEANPHNATMAVRNVARNDMPWITVCQAAVSDHDGTLAFSSGWNGTVADIGDYGGLITVPCTTVDQLSDRYGAPDLVVMDIEGHEGRALAGATRTLCSGADWAIEVHVGHGLERVGQTASDVLAFFPPAEFELFVHRDGDRTPTPFLAASDPLPTERFFLTALAARGRQGESEESTG